MGQPESSALVTLGVLDTGDGRGGRHGMWGRRRSWGEFGGDSATSGSDSACVVCGGGKKGRAWRRAAVAEEGRDGEAGGGVGAVRRHRKKAELSLAPEQTLTW